MKFRVLIAEDDQPRAVRMKNKLNEHIKEDLDITVTYSVNKDVVKRRYDIAIVDLNMPYLDSNLSNPDENAGKFIIDQLVEFNPDIFIIICTAVSSRKTVAKASNAAGKDFFEYVEKTFDDKYIYIVIEEIKDKIKFIKDRYPERIDYGKLCYERKDEFSYKYDNICVNGKQIDLLGGRQKAALYKYLVNPNQWLSDRGVLEFAGYDIDGLDHHQIAKRYKDNIRQYFTFLNDAGLELKSDRAGKHRLTKMTGE